jgi:hypothetical protein
MSSFLKDCLRVSSLNKKFYLKKSLHINFYKILLLNSVFLAFVAGEFIGTA